MLFPVRLSIYVGEGGGHDKENIVVDKARLWFVCDVFMAALMVVNQFIICTSRLLNSVSCGGIIYNMNSYR